MPRIRDLGINVIPVTMRPPEIGPGGGYHLTAAAADHRMYMSISSCSDNSDCATSTCCGGGSQSPCDNSRSGSSTKQECNRTNQPPGCGGNSNCPQNSCNNSGQGNFASQANNASAADGLSVEVIAQLKQHLRDRVGTERWH